MKFLANHLFIRYELLRSVLEGNLLSVLSLLYDRIDFALTRSADVFLAKMPGIAPPPSMTPFAALP